MRANRSHVPQVRRQDVRKLFDEFGRLPVLLLRVVGVGVDKTHHVFLELCSQGQLLIPSQLRVIYTPRHRELSLRKPVQVISHTAQMCYSLLQKISTDHYSKYYSKLFLAEYFTTFFIVKTMVYYIKYVILSWPIQHFTVFYCEYHILL